MYRRYALQVYVVYRRTDSYSAWFLRNVPSKTRFWLQYSGTWLWFFVGMLYGNAASTQYHTWYCTARRRSSQRHVMSMTASTIYGQPQEFWDLMCVNLTCNDSGQMSQDQQIMQPWNWTSYYGISHCGIIFLHTRCVCAAVRQYGATDGRSSSCSYV